MDLTEMAEEHMKVKAVEYASPMVSVSRAQAEKLYPSEPVNRFNSDNMNKAFADVFGGGE